jgi:hypothetical protein
MTISIKGKPEKRRGMIFKSSQGFIFDSKVALKLLKPEIASDRETIERFSNLRNSCAGYS